MLRQLTVFDKVLWVAALLCGATTVWLSLWAVPPGATAFDGSDKVEHAVAYFVTSLLLLLAGVWRPGRGEGPLWRWRWWLVGALIAAGGAIEVIQTQVPKRKGDMLDWASEVIAVCAAIVVIAILRARDNATERPLA